MYKVFIENRPIFFTDIISKKKNIFLIDSNTLLSVKDGLIPQIYRVAIENDIHVYSNEMEKEFDRLFLAFVKVEAAGGIVRNKSKFLFIKRNGFWDIPKGKRESSESLEMCAIREIEEECGLKKPEIIGFICSTFHTYEYKGIPTLKKTAWFSLDIEGEMLLKPQIEEGITDVVWMKKKEIEIVRNNTFRSIIEVLDVYFQTK